MIRINLLPAARKQSRSALGGFDSDAKWYVLYAAAAMLAAVGCGLLHWNESALLVEHEVRNATLRQRIELMNQQTASIDAVREDLARSEALEAVVTELQHARYGPTEILMEFSRILSVGGGPTIDAARLEELRRSNPLAGFNASWDARRMWLTEIREEDQRTLRIKGAAKTNEDVAELLRRLVLSESFYDVRLERTEAGRKSMWDGIVRATDVEVVSFTISARVRY